MKGYNVIEISARAKSWLQNTLKLISFFKDDVIAGVKEIHLRDRPSDQSETLEKIPNGEKIIIDGSLRKAFVDDLTGDGIKELIVETIPGHSSATHIFSYKNGYLAKVPIFDENGNEFKNTMLATSKEIRFEDLDSDNIKEIILPIRNYGDEFIEPTYYYRWNNEGFILYDKKDIILSQSGGREVYLSDLYGAIKIIRYS